MNPRRQLGQAVLDARGNFLNAIGKVVGGRLQSLLDLGGSRINAVLDARGAAQSRALSTLAATVVSRSRAIRSDFFTTTSRYTCWFVASLRAPNSAGYSSVRFLPDFTERGTGFPAARALALHETMGP